MAVIEVPQPRIEPLDLVPDFAGSWGWHQLVLETGWAHPERLADAASNGYLPVEPWDTEFPFDPRVAYVGKRI